VAPLVFPYFEEGALYGQFNFKVAVGPGGAIWTNSVNCGTTAAPTAKRVGTWTCPSDGMGNTYHAHPDFTGFFARGNYAAFIGKRRLSNRFPPPEAAAKAARFVPSMPARDCGRFPTD